MKILLAKLSNLHVGFLQYKVNIAPYPTPYKRNIFQKPSSNPFLRSQILSVKSRSGPTAHQAWFGPFLFAKVKPVNDTSVQRVMKGPCKKVSIVLFPLNRCWHQLANLLWKIFAYLHHTYNRYLYYPKPRRARILRNWNNYSFNCHN